MSMEEPIVDAIEQSNETIASQVGDFFSEEPVEVKSEEIAGEPENLEEETAAPVAPTEEETPGETTEPAPTNNEETETQSLKAQLEAAQAKIASFETAQATPTATPEQPAANQPPQLVDFISEEEHDDLLTSREAFNKALNKVYGAAVETVYRSIPGLVNSLTTYAVDLRIRTDDFFKQNEDLMPHRAKLGEIANKVQADNPTLPIPDLFKKIEEEGRKTLNVPKKAAAVTTKPQTPKPVFPNAGGSRQATGGQPKVDPQQKAINDMLSSLER